MEDPAAAGRRDLPRFVLDEEVGRDELDDYRPTPPRVLPDGSRIGGYIQIFKYIINVKIMDNHSLVSHTGVYSGGGGQRGHVSPQILRDDCPPPPEF